MIKYQVNRYIIINYKVQAPRITTETSAIILLQPIPHYYTQITTIGARLVYDWCRNCNIILRNFFTLRNSHILLLDINVFNFLLATLV